MNDTAPETTEAVEEPYYTETIVEYRDNRRQRAVLGILLVILFFLLIGAAYAVVQLTPGKGAPQGQAATSQGMKWIRSIYGWGAGYDQSLLGPTDVAIDENGTIWVVSGHGTIAGFNPDGSVKKVIKPEKVVSLEGIDVDEDGNLFVTDYGGQVVEIDPVSGSTVDTWAVELPQGIDVQDGRIAVSSSNGIAIFTVNDSEILLQVGGQRGWAKDQFDMPHSIVVGDDGMLYVTDTQNRRVKALTPQGRNAWILGEAPNRNEPGVADVRSQAATMAAAPFMLPSGQTFDGKGRLVVVDPFKFRIAIVDPKTGEVVHEEGKNGKQGRQAYYGEQGAADGFFNYPTGIDYDPRRDWFAVADTANNRVQIVRIPDTGGNVIAPLIGSFRWPMCVFCIPFILLLIALIVALARRRRERELTPEEAAALEAGGTMEPGDIDY